MLPTPLTRPQAPQAPRGMAGKSQESGKSQDTGLGDGHGYRAGLKHKAADISRTKSEETLRVSWEALFKVVIHNNKT